MTSKSNPNNPLGVAFDIGSTTLAGALVDLKSGEVIATHSLPNPQNAHGAGADIISRIRAVASDPELLAELHRLTIAAMNEIMEALGPPTGAEIRALSAAGNSVMEHILLNINPEPLGRVPYRPVFKEARTLAAKELGLVHAALSADATLYCFPLIGGFIGGDTVAMMLSLALEPGGGNELAIDIGTNSEIVLATGKAVYAASAAAGPAFEGGEVEFGMSASKGAIRAVTVGPDDIKLDVVGGVAPRGICGSGLSDLISGLLRADVIDRSGRIKGADEIDTNLSTRIKPGAESNSFLIFMGPGGAMTLESDRSALLSECQGGHKGGGRCFDGKSGAQSS